MDRAVRFARRREAPMVFTASFNEWSEGHYLEPDETHGLDWLKALGRTGSAPGG